MSQTLSPLSLQLAMQALFADVSSSLEGAMTQFQLLESEAQDDADGEIPAGAHLHNYVDEGISVGQVVDEIRFLAAAFESNIRDARSSDRQALLGRLADLESAAKEAKEELIRLADDLRASSTVDDRWDGTEPEAEAEYDHLVKLVNRLEGGLSRA